MYQLQYAEQNNILPTPNSKPITGIYPVRNKSTNELIICVRQDRFMFGYKYIPKISKWEHQWTKTIFDREGYYPLDLYPWTTADNILPDRDVIIIKHPNGVRIYKPDFNKPGLTLLKEDIHFHEIYNKQVYWGKFYPDQNEIGVLSMNDKNEVKFYVMAHDSVWDNTTYPVIPVEVEASIASTWKSEYQILLSNLDKKFQKSFIIRTNQGLDVYKFDDSYMLKKIISSPQIVKQPGKKINDQLLFINLTKQPLKDILQINKTGLYIYQYDKKQNNYKFHSSSMNEEVIQYQEFLQTFDLNKDGTDEIIFTGNYGLKALSFDVRQNTWNTFLNADNLKGLQKYSNIQGILQTNQQQQSEISFFTQDIQGNLQWAKLINNKQTRTQNQQSTRVVQEETIPSYMALAIRENAEIPTVISRSIETPKPTLRWAEQWDDDFLQNTVTSSGEIYLNIPLIDLSPITNWKYELALSYSSQQSTADLLGIGWTLPIGQDFIFIDHRGSIFPEDHQYYLVANGETNRLKLKNKQQKLLNFEITDENITIQYDETNELWIIDGETEQTIYGKAKLEQSKDICQFSLKWPNWNNAGTNPNELQSVIIGWYLNARIDKHNNNTLFYYYEQDISRMDNGKSYTSAIRLQKISDNQNIDIKFSYARKSDSEFDVTKPNYDKNNIMFPVPLQKNCYLEGLTVTTDFYEQNFKFNYEIKNDERLLSTIKQKLSLAFDPIFEFKYKIFSGKQIIKNCKTPRGLTADYDFETMSIPLDTSTVMRKYPIKEKVKISNGPDFVLMANKFANKIIVRVFDRDITEIKLNIILNPMTVDDYIILSYENAFSVLVINDNNRILYLYNRNKDDWSIEPSIYKFNKNAKIKLSESIIAASDGSTLKIFEYIENNPKWTVTNFQTNSIISIMIDNKIIAAYDNQQLQIFYQTSKAIWKIQVLDTTFGNLYQITNKFLLKSELKTEWKEAIDNSSLQIYKNIILLSKMQENNGNISVNLRLFLLDDNYNIIKRINYEYKKEYVDNLTEDFKYDGSTYTLRYEKVNGMFKLKITAVSGKIIEEISKIRNKNIKHDEFIKFYKTLNESEGWKSLFESKILLNWSLYQIQMSSQGIYVGKDVFLRFTGSSWEQQSQPEVQPMLLGKHFILEAINDDRLSFNLFAQGLNKNKEGQALKEINLKTAGQLINRYPSYIAYQDKNNNIQVITFKNDKILGNTRTYQNEELLLESDFKNLLTMKNVTSLFHNDPMECRVRPISIMITPDDQKFVKKVTLIDGDIQRHTGYKRNYKKNDLQSTITDTMRIIPGGNETISGWTEIERNYNINNGNTTKTQNYYNSFGKKVFNPSDDETPSEKSTALQNPEKQKNPMILYDNTDELVISNFSPFSSKDNMIDYYGFESYESNIKSSWKIVGSKIKQGFSFTGQNYLQLDLTGSNKEAYLQKKYIPKDQNTTYLASIWVRSKAQLTLFTSVSYLKATIHTISGQKIITLLSEAKHQFGDWYYLELRLDFQLIKEIYQQYMTHMEESSVNNTSNAIELKDTRFTITLRVEANPGEKFSIDHIRFSPFYFDFSAFVYDPISKKKTSTIQSNGLVLRTVYNRYQQEIASILEDGQVITFSSTSKTNQIVTTQTRTIDKPSGSTLIIEPENGFHETFDAYSLKSRWKLHSKIFWQRAPGQLWHKDLNRHRIEANNELFIKSASSIRLYFALQNVNAAIYFIWQNKVELKLIKQLNNEVKLLLPNKVSGTILPPAGEIIIMFEQNYIWIWINGVLLIEDVISLPEENPWSSFSIDVQGQVLIEDLFVMNRPQVKMEYNNAFGDKTQTIQLENVLNAQVTETIFDEIGREAITTKSTRIHRKSNQSLLKYHPSFVTNKNPTSDVSVFRAGKIQGDVNELNPSDQGFPYKQIEYERNPLNKEKVIGLPGSEFTITGQYATKKSSDSKIPFLSNIFPSNQGFYQKVVELPNGTKKVSVFDKFKNRVAYYKQVPSFNHILSTYEYDEENRLVKILSPIYHENVKTAFRLTPLNTNEKLLSNEEKQWQKLLATYYNYDENGNLIRKQTPDTGITKYLYNSADQMRFMVSLDKENNIKKIVFYDYDSQGQMTRTGTINQPLPMSTLREHLESSYLPYSQNFQLFDYADDHPNPIVRSRVKQFITYNQNEPLIEKLHFNAKDQIVTKETILSQIDEFEDLQKSYTGNKLYTLTYPSTSKGDKLKLFHNYNKLGQLISIGTASNSNLISFTYNPDGQLSSEQHQFNKLHNFTRRFSYNSPGFLEKIHDPYLTEEISYTTNGYGHSGFGDGMIMQTIFNATWPSNADGRWFQVNNKEFINKISGLCLKALKRTGYLSENNQPIKLLNQNNENSLPLECAGNTGRYLSKLIATKQIPSYYGYRLAYGNHQELVKAKYFSNESEAKIGPLQPNSFAEEIAKLTKKQSIEIWNILVDSGFILTDQQHNDFDTIIGKKGNSFFQNENLITDLKQLNDNYIVYAEPIEKLCISSLYKRQNISLDDFEKIFLSWDGVTDTSSFIEINSVKESASRIGKMLIEKGYLSTKTKTASHVLKKKFTTMLQKYNMFIPDIIRVLSKHFTYALSEHAFDLESYNIDANGNHRMFWNGFNRYELSYRNATNQIASINLNQFDKLSPDDVTIPSSKSQNFPMQHDSLGNVIQAIHNGIKNIEYHPVSQRTTRIDLNDGRYLKFFYDSQGERVLKQVFNSDETLLQETHYLRDEKGRVLADRVTKFLPGNKSKRITTAYLYGPRGLLGFMRNNKLYSVTTDHLGSVRLVIHNDQVVAAYDYMPYGQIMRTFGNDPACHIVYRYTGQEWDEETGLYNFHARLYDPSIGRFYQPDPRAQYFSPYKYAGNSPIALIDPDGEFAFLFLFAAIFAVSGLYLGGAAANNRWNPLEGDFSDPGTWIGMGGGAVAGFFLPIGFSASVGTIGLIPTIIAATGGAYLTTAAANQCWDLTKWEWSRPKPWNAIFQGIGSGSGLAGGVGMAHNFASKVFGAGTLGSKIFLTASYSVAAGMTYYGGIQANNGQIAFWKWDWTKPSTWSSLVDGFDTGMGWLQGTLEIGRGLTKLIKNRKLLSKIIKVNKLKFNQFKTILKNPQHPLYKTTGSIVMMYFMGSSASGELDITKWNVAAFSTYEGVINGLFMGKDIGMMLKHARATKKKASKASPSENLKNKIENWPKKIINSIKNIKTLRTRKKYTDIIMEETYNKKPNSNENVEKNPKNEKEILDKKKLLEAEEIVQKSSEKLNDWRSEADKISQKKKEIFPEEDVDFLKCRRFGRRRRVGPGSSASCSVEVKTDNDDDFSEIVDLLSNLDIRTKRNTNKFELIQPQFDQEAIGFNPNLPDNFKEHLSLILDRTPNTLVGSKPNFFPDLILGSMLTIPASTSSLNGKKIFVKNENVKFSTIKETFDLQIVKTCWKIELNGKTDLISRAYFIERKLLTSKIQKYIEKISGKDGYVHKLTSEEINKISDPYLRNFLEKINSKKRLTGKESQEFIQEFLKDTTLKTKYSKSEMSDIAKKLDLKNDFSIHEDIYFMDSKQSLYVNNLPETNSKKYNYRHEPSTDAEIDKFKSIEPIINTKLETHLEKLKSDNIEVVKEGIKGFSEDALKIFNENQNILQLGDVVPESRFHAFLYGALTLNFKYRFYLDVYVERIAGRGYADLMLLSRKGGPRNKNWNAIPIVIELKSDKTSATGATDQTIGTGYLYNLSLRTVAENALVVGINSKTSDIQIHQEKIPSPDNFAAKIIENPFDKIGIEQVLRDKYFSISPLAIKTSRGKNDHYLSRLITGEMMTIDSPDKYVYFHKDGDFANKLTTYFYKDKTGNKNQWVMLNIVESGVDTKNKFKDVDLDKLKYELPNVDIESFTRIDIKVNSQSKEGWSPDQPKRTVGQTSDTNPDLYFFQDKTNIQQIKVSDITLEPTNKFTKLETIEIDDLFEIDSSNSAIAKNKLLDNLDLSPMKNLINSESDFQAIFQGLLRNMKGSDGVIIKCFPEANPSKAGRIDLVISKLRKFNNNVFEEHLTVLELKYAETSNKANQLLIDASKQVMKYRSNLKTFTDLGVFIPIAVVFDKSKSKIIYELQTALEIPHTSDGEVPDISLQDLFPNDNRKRPRGDEDDVDIPIPTKKPKKYENLHIKHKRETGISQEGYSPSRSISGSSKLEFWPANFIKYAGTSLISLISTMWSSTPSDVQKINPPSHEFDYNYESSKSGPTILQMGDKYLENTDLNSNLTLGVYLIRKLTGYRPPQHKITRFDENLNITIGIQATAIVDHFMDYVISLARTCGLSESTCNILDNTTTYYNAIKIVRKQIIKQQLNIIPKLLFNQIILQNINNIKSNTNENQAEIFLNEVKNNLDKLKDDFYEMEDAWISENQCNNDETTEEELIHNEIDELICEETSKYISHFNICNNTLL